MNLNAYCLFNHMTWIAAHVIITIQVQIQRAALYSTGISAVHYTTLYTVNKIKEQRYTQKYPRLMGKI